MPSPSDYYAPWVREELQEKVLAHYERRLAEDAAIIASLRDRLRVLEPMVCRCGYHALGVGKQGELWPLCPDCMISLWGGDGRAAACLANGMKALCGRKLLEGC